MKKQFLAAAIATAVAIPMATTAGDVTLYGTIHMSTDSYDRDDVGFGGVGFGGTVAEEDNVYVKTWGMTATHFLSTVDYKIGPLAKTGFLNKSSSVSVKYSEREVARQYKYTTRSVKGRLVAGPDIIMEAAYSRTSNNISYDGDSDRHFLAGGVYLSDSSAIKFNYERYDQKYADAETYAVNYEQLISLAGDTYIGFNGTVLRFKSDYSSSTNIAGTVDYYFNRQFSVGASITHSPHEYRGYGIGAQYFLNTHIGLSANYHVLDFHDGYGSDTLTVNLTGQF